MTYFLFYFSECRNISDSCVLHLILRPLKGSSRPSSSTTPGTSATSGGDNQPLAPVQKTHQQSNKTMRQKKFKNTKPAVADTDSDSDTETSSDSSDD